MFGNYPVNDDWVFFWQVKAFSQGIFKINAELDPSFVAQGILGLLWSKIFGLNYISLQALTFLISLGTVFLVYRTLRLAGSQKVFSILGAMILFFNPLFFASSFTFMTDNYLLFFLSAATYFFIRHFKTASYRDLIIGSLFGFLAAMTRQNGLLVFVPVILLGFTAPRDKVRKILLPAVFLAISISCSFMWPRFGANKRFIEAEDFAGRLTTLLYAPQYLLIFLSPVLMGLSIGLRGKIKKMLFVVLSALFAYALFVTDIFPMGNVLYLEELYSKSDFRSNFSIFDNTFTKLFLSSLWGLASAKGAVFLYEKMKKGKSAFKLSPQDSFLILAAVLNFGLLFVSSDIYDRYLLPVFLFLLLFLLGRLGGGSSLNKFFSYGVLAVLAVISIFLQWDFSAKNKLMWEQVEDLRQSTGLSTSIDLNDTYINHTIVRESGDFTGLEPRRGSFEPVCFVQDYTTDTSSPFFKKAESLMRVLSAKGLENPKPPMVRKKSMPRIKNNLDKLVYNKEYSSLVYGLVGKKAYVGSFCVDSKEN